MCTCVQKSHLHPSSEEGVALTSTVLSVWCWFFTPECSVSLTFQCSNECAWAGHNYSTGL
jgi:uncharacterized membrane protein